jgi:hypothetical protein
MPRVRGGGGGTPHMASETECSKQLRSADVYSPWSSNIAACIERVRLMRRHVRDSHESPNSEPMALRAYKRLRAPLCLPLGARGDVGDFPAAA